MKALDERKGGMFYPYPFHTGPTASNSYSLY